jgi:hypothetical protein
MKVEYFEVNHNCHECIFRKESVCLVDEDVKVSALRMPKHCLLWKEPVEVTLIPMVEEELDNVIPMVEEELDNEEDN